MTQLDLITPRAAPRRKGIDLRCCDVGELLEEIRGGVDLAVADPPWTYDRVPGGSRPEDHYACLDLSTIAAHLIAARERSSRLAVWTTWPFLPSLIEILGPSKTGGAWVKSGAGDSGHYGQGYHWAGCSEPVLVWSSPGAHIDRTAPVRNAWMEAPSRHSRKPVRWQAQWIRRWVPPGGLVLDLYAGLGSVAEAVVLAGEERRYVGAEIDPERHRAALALIAQGRPAV